MKHSEIKKIMIGMAVIFSVTLSTFGQSTGDDFSDLFNAMKSAVRGTDKEAYAMRMLSSEVASQPNNQFLMDASLQMVATTFAEEGEFVKAAEWTSKIKDEQLRQGTVYFTVGALTSAGKFEKAHKLLDEDIAKLQKDDRGDLITTSENLQLSLVYGELLFAEARYFDASAYLKAALEVPKYVEKYKELYIQSLIRVNSSALSENSITTVFLMEGHRSSAFLDDVRSWFNKRDGNDQGYVNLEKKAKQDESERLNKKISKMAVNMPAPDFLIKDIDGNTVSLASLKGKTVILDFWATWCQPCVASFPGMQKAVRYYKNDPSVVFMFIHTAEKKGAKVEEEAKALIKQKGYDFDIYLDLKDPDTGKCPVATAFGVRGIPAKFVIDKQGIIKFSNTGYVSEDEAIEEIKLMVEKSNLH